MIRYQNDEGKCTACAGEGGAHTCIDLYLQHKGFGKIHMQK